MIDYTKPIRWGSSKAPAKVLMLVDEYGAWVMVGPQTANLFDLDGKAHYGGSVENVPEPIVTWVVVWPALAIAGPEEWARKKVSDPYSKSIVALKLTYTPGDGATVEVVEERK